MRTAAGSLVAVMPVGMLLSRPAVGRGYGTCREEVTPPAPLALVAMPRCLSLAGFHIGHLDVFSRVAYVGSLDAAAVCILKYHGEEDEAED